MITSNIKRKLVLIILFLISLLYSDDRIHQIKIPMGTNEYNLNTFKPSEYVLGPYIGPVDFDKNSVLYIGDSYSYEKTTVIKKFSLDGKYLGMIDIDSISMIEIEIIGDYLYITGFQKGLGYFVYKYSLKENSIINTYHIESYLNPWGLYDNKVVWMNRRNDWIIFDMEADSIINMEYPHSKEKEKIIKMINKDMKSIYGELMDYYIGSFNQNIVLSLFNPNNSDSHLFYFYRLDSLSNLIQNEIEIDLRETGKPIVDQPHSHNRIINNRQICFVGYKSNEVIINLIDIEQFLLEN